MCSPILAVRFNLFVLLALALDLGVFHRKAHKIGFADFFFQAEDGIRALYVTGVQTCALPICSPAGKCFQLSGGFAASAPLLPIKAVVIPAAVMVLMTDLLVVMIFSLPIDRETWSPTTVRRRSEERRVGKESSTKRTPHH